MAKEIAPPKVTGGGGFTFEHKVCALWMAHMLSRRPPLEPGIGFVERLDFQTRVDGWYLDDVLLKLRSGADHFRAAVSIKSNAQFGVNSAPSDFVHSVWEQFGRGESKAFEEETDVLVLVTAPLPHGLRTALDALQLKVLRNDPALLGRRLAAANWTNQDERDLFESFACPADLCDSESAEVSKRVRLLKRCRFLEFDFERPVSKDEQFALELCRSLLASGEVGQASELWTHLIQTAAAYAPQAGSLTAEDLSRSVRGRFELLSLPDHRRDWQRLHNHSTAAAGQVADAVGGAVRLPRDAELASVQEALEKGGVALLGPSGCGKSALAKHVAGRWATSNGPCLWFDAHSFERPDFADFQAVLQLDHSLAELAAFSPGKRPAIAFDGLDRTFSDRSFALVGALIRTLRGKVDEGAWRVLIPCQQDEWRRVEEELRRAGIETSEWTTVELDAPTAGVLAPVAERFPKLAALLRDPKLRAVLRNLKILDVLALNSGRGEALTAAGWVGESSAADWFWKSFISSRPGGHARSAFLHRLAQIQADEMRVTTPVSRFDPSDTAPLESLVADRVCRSDNGKVRFEHDLLSDWSRLSLLVSHSEDLRGFLRPRLTSPLWHRAVRLYALHLLEHRADVGAWRAHLQSFEAGPEDLLRDLFLDAAVLSSNAQVLLDRIHEDLTDKDGWLLGRLLNRFQVIATLPDPRVAELMRREGLDGPASGVRFRYPIWRYWPGLLTYLHRRREALVPLAPGGTAALALAWLQYAPSTAPLRREAAEVAVHIAEHAAAHPADRLGEHGVNQLIYQALLAAGADLPDAVGALSLRIAGRIPDPKLDALEQQRLDRPNPFARSERDPRPWPDGPRRRTPRGFREAVLDTAALGPLFCTHPKLVRELVLAVLIEAPSDRADARGLGFGRSLGLHAGTRWHPALYTDGPFLRLLLADFAEGLELAARVVDFATDRLLAPGSADDGWSNDGSGLSDRANVSDPSAGPHITVPLPEGPKDFVGDATVYGWSAGCGVAPEAVQAALMALEQFFYLQLDGGAPIEGQAATVLRRVRSAAFLKVLLEVGKRERALFAGVLQPLLASPHLCRCDISVQVHGRSTLGIGAPLRGNTFVTLASAFHGMKHRSVDVRHVLMELVLIAPSVRPYFLERAMQWECDLKEDRVASDEVDFLQQMVNYARFDSYQVQKLGDQDAYVNTREQERQALLAPELARQQRDTDLLVLPSRCRRLIDERESLPEDQLEAFWGLLREIAAAVREPPPAGASACVERLLNWLRRLLAPIASRGAPEVASGSLPTRSSDEAEGRRAHALAAGIALLTLQHTEWLSRHAERRAWCLDRLEALVRSPPPPLPFDPPTSISDWTWDCFAAETVPTLWAQQPDDSRLRQLAARLVFAPHNMAVRILFSRCSEHRVRLGDGLEGLRRVLFEWASVRLVADASAHMRVMPANASRARRIGRRMERWKSHRIRDFVRGSLSAPSMKWTDMDVGARLRTLLGLSKRASFPRFDLGLIRAAHEWVPRLELLPDSERRYWIAFWDSALTEILPRRAPPGAPQSRESGPQNSSLGSFERDEFPTEDEGWLIARAACAVHALGADSERLWRPALDLPASAHRWSADFLGAFHRDALRRDVAPLGYVLTVRAMVDFALERQAMGVRDEAWYHFRDAWEALIGVDAFTQGYWEARHAPLVSSMLDIIEKWASLRWTVSSHILSFSIWLTKEAAVPARLRALSWIEHSLRMDDGEWLIDRQDDADALASLLHVVWTQHEAQLKAADRPLAAFRELLGALARQQNPIALELTGRIGGAV